MPDRARTNAPNLPPALYGPLWTRAPGVGPLVELALDLRWSWSHTADDLWSQLDPDLWRLTRNPWLVLQTISTTRLESVLADAGFQKKLQELDAERQAYASSPAWFQMAHPTSALNAVAYFSLEFMLSEALPIYSGGLGNVAGDQLKAASDLGVPVIGVGLLYQQGYFRQALDGAGAQRAYYPHNDPMQLPILPVRAEDGEWVRIKLATPGYALWFRAWEARVGRTKLYLLDSNDPANPPAERGITSELYGGDAELRLLQELALGIAGWRLLEQLGVCASVCHLNEGHAAFAVLERAHSFMRQSGRSFHEALAVTRAGNLFTTHTPVAAGFDRFAPQLMHHYLGAYAEQALNIPFAQLMALGRREPADEQEAFNMAYLALRGSLRANGVSRLHGQVSRRVFQTLFPRWPETEVPVRHVTNGVHMPSWDSEQADALWTAACGKERWRGGLERVGNDVAAVADEALWKMRGDARGALVEHTRSSLARQLAAAGAGEAEVKQAGAVLDANVLTLGFARRFAAYKRPNLLLYDRARLVRLLTDGRRPVQLVIAGKAHPQDETGKSMVQQWVQFIRGTPQVRARAVFLSDYDMVMAEHLVQGVDLWINTPRRPWEACGTSGMKVLVNGGLNLSELDGWWAEAYRPDVGWALGDGREHDDDAGWDRHEADELYRILEQQVVPCFYERDAHGVPRAWTAKMRESMARLTPTFSANRAVREYTEDHYLSCAGTFAERARDGGALGMELVQWRTRIQQHWRDVYLGARRVETTGTTHRVTIQVYLGLLDPKEVRVELYAEAGDGRAATRTPMSAQQPLVGAAHGYSYSATVSAERPAQDYTARALPHHPKAQVPLEAWEICWER